MRDQADLARGWLAKGDSDRTTADRLLQGGGPYDTACFHAQQASEKYLKAVLAFAGHSIPRTHDLEVLHHQCLRVSPNLNLDRAELASLTPYAVQLRYDHEFWPSVATAQQALAAADRVRAAVFGFLPKETHTS